MQGRWRCSVEGRRRATSSEMTDRPRVVHLAPALFGSRGVVGGAERYVCELARHMARVTPTKLVAFAGKDSVERLGDLEIRTIGRPWHVRGQASNPFALRALSTIRGCDVVHCHQQHILMSSIAALAGRLSGRRVFCSDLGGGGWDISAYVSTDRWYHGHLHLSEYSRRVFGHDALPNARVIYGGVDTDRFSPSQGTEPREIDCLFVGRLLPHKGVDVLLEAVPPGLRTIVIGPAPDTRYLDELVRLAVGKQVSFWHDCDDDRLVEAYRRARCVVLPSVYRDRYGRETRVPELLGQTLLEGMACGAAAIASDVASLPEIVEDGKNGLVVPAGDREALRRALEWIRDHPERARDMGCEGRRRVLAHFTWPRVVARCLEAYRA